MRAPLDALDRSVEVRRHRPGVERRRHRHQPEIGARLSLRAARHRQREVGVEAALVQLVEDHHGDAVEERVALQHAHEHALGDYQQPCARPGDALEAHLETHLAAQLPTLFDG
ncbi:MAG TPA: hypothetical protein VN923_20050, partial [Thermoanaerobaculia bacterium]|nr:hypothetical protein [Thermoanaerobaculia bacterium]